MHNTVSPCLRASRLFRRLTEMEIAGPPVSTDQFAERVGALLDLPGSVAISKALGGLEQAPSKPDGNTPDAIRDAVLSEHAALVRDIAKSFVPGAGTVRNRLPTAAEFLANCIREDGFSTGAPRPNRASAFAPYRKHYLALQGRIALASRRLRQRTAAAVSGLSPMLARVAMLDLTLGDVLHSRQQRYFEKIQILLERHFNHLLQFHWQTLSGSTDSTDSCDLSAWMAPGGWIASFCGRMQSLLLAELEVRLQPVLGLVESIGVMGGDD